MSLVTMKEILLDAEKRNYGVPAFTVLNTDALRGIIEAAEYTKSPIILQMGEMRMEVAPLNLVGPALLNAARTAKVPVAVHLDQGIRYETIEEALELGFTSVMINSSRYPLKENILRTEKIIQMASRYGATVEAQVGRITEGRVSNKKNHILTIPSEVEKFVEKTTPDAISVMIGNVPGWYLQPMKLDFDLLSQIRSRVKLPLVLHGGSGMSQEEFRDCIDLGVRKINIATVLYQSSIRIICSYIFSKRKDSSFIELQNCTSETVYAQAIVHMQMLRSRGKA